MLQIIQNAFIVDAACLYVLHMLVIMEDYSIMWLGLCSVGKTANVKNHNFFSKPNKVNMTHT